jgi:hypothetical protein
VCGKARHPIQNHKQESSELHPWGIQVGRCWQSFMTERFDEKGSQHSFAQIV